MPAACGYPEGRSDPDIIATSILSRASEELLFDARQFAALSEELGRVLRLIRGAYPARASIHARDRYVAGQIVLEVEWPLYDAIRAARPSEAGGTGIVTGQSAFDDLNARLGGVGGMHTSGLAISGYLTLCLDELVNLPAASKAYSGLDGVRNAGPHELLEDGPDIDAVRDGDTWYVVFRNAWEDCLVGCINKELSYFTVTGDTVVAVESSQAAANPNFASLEKLVSWRSAAADPPCTAPGAGPTGGVAVGFGVYIGQNPVTSEIVVVSPLVGCSAYRAGVQAGDIVLAVDGKPGIEWAESEIRASMGAPVDGTEGEEVKLRVRHADGSEQDITVSSEMVAFPQRIRLDDTGMELLDGTVPGVIVNVLPLSQSRSERAGVVHDDLILAVNGEPTAGWTPREAADRIAAFGGDQFTMRVRHIDGVTEDVTLRPASEFCQLMIPALYMGEAYLNGMAAPAGSTIEAVQGGVTWGTATTGDAGHYEITVPEWMRESPPCSPDGPISFRMGDLLANESAAWPQATGLLELDLTFGSPSPTPTAGAALIPALRSRRVAL
jgi:hypothetical protein